MRNLGNKGFSSKEFLIVVVGFVIVVVGIMPIVFNMIEKTRQGVVTDSVTLFKEQVDRRIFDQISEGNEVLDGCYIVMDDGNLCLEEVDGVCNNGNLLIDLDGMRPDGGEVNIKDNKVRGVYNIFIDNKYVNEKDDKLYVSSSPDKKIVCE